MTTLMLIRHGETAWNVTETVRGRTDIELGETGIKQAELLSRYLQNTPLSAIYSSPLKRAAVTAEIIARPHNMNIMLAPELIDQAYGIWEGIPIDVVKQKFQNMYTEWVTNPDKVTVPGGESMESVRSRVWHLIEHITIENMGTVALVSHRAVHQILIMALLGLDNSHFWNIRLNTCGLTVFLHENSRFILLKHNDTSFLQSGLNPA